MTTRASIAATSAFSLLAGIDLVTGKVHTLRLTYQPGPIYYRGVHKTAHSARQFGRKLDYHAWHSSQWECLLIKELCHVSTLSFSYR
jgi:hypothetical protein